VIDSIPCYTTVQYYMRNDRKWILMIEFTRRNIRLFSEFLHERKRDLARVLCLPALYTPERCFYCYERLLIGIAFKVGRDSTLAYHWVGDPILFEENI